MNVKLAPQTFSASAAGAIDFLHEEALLPQFQNSEATTEFIKKMDLAFDLMNSRNPFAKGTKKNQFLWSTFPNGQQNVTS